MQLLWRTVWRFLKKLNIEPPYDPAIPLLGIHTEKTLIQNDTCTPTFTTELFTIAKTWKQSKCPSTDERIKRVICVCVCIYIYIYIMKCYSATKRMTHAATWMELETVKLSEVSQTKKHI